MLANKAYILRGSVTRCCVNPRSRKSLLARSGTISSTADEKSGKKHVLCCAFGKRARRGAEEESPVSLRSNESTGCVKARQHNVTVTD